MKNFILTVLCCFGLQAAVCAQGFEVPDYDFKTAEDYPKYEQAVLDAYDWVLKTPVAEQGDKAGAVNEFIMLWSMGSPTVSVGISDVLGDILTENNKLMLICLGGCTAYLLETKKSDGVLNTMEKRGGSLQEQVDATYAAIRDVAAYCELNKDVIAPCKAVNKYLEMDKKGKLKKYIEKSFSQAPQVK